MSSAAFGQTMIGDQEVSEEDMQLVTEHCASLADLDAAATDPDGPAADDIEDDDFAADVDTDAMDADDEAESETATADAPGADSTAEDGGTLDLAAITAADCEAAGLATQ